MCSLLAIICTIETLKSLQSQSWYQINIIIASLNPSNFSTPAIHNSNPVVHIITLPFPKKFFRFSIYMYGHKKSFKRICYNVNFGSTEECVCWHCSADHCRRYSFKQLMRSHSYWPEVNVVARHTSGFYSHTFFLPLYP